MEKKFSDDYFTYIVVSYFDELDIYSSITDVPYYLTTPNEFTDVKQMTDYIKELKDIGKDGMGKFLYMAIIQPISQSCRYTNKHTFNLN